MIQNFHRYSQYYDLLYADKNYKRETDYIAGHIRNLLPQAATILELGSGTGNHAQHFSADGFSVTGIERSADMLAISLAKDIPGFRPVLGDMSTFQLEERFDVAISLFHSLCYLTTNDELLGCFSSVRHHLKPLGLFCFDFWYGPAVLHDLPATRIRKIRKEQLDIHRIAETEMFTEQNVAVVSYEMIIRNEENDTAEVIKEKHPMRYLSIPEIDLLCRQSGFRLVSAETFPDGGTPGLDSWNVFSILQRLD